MKNERIVLHVLRTYPEFYLQSEDYLFIEANNALPKSLTTSEFRDLLNELEAQKLVISQRVQGVMKWKITGAGRAWLKES